MRKPSINVARDLRGQRAPGRSPETMEITPVTGTIKKPTMTAPGEGGVALAPGSQMAADERQSRSAGLFGDAMRRYGGGRSDS